MISVVLVIIAAVVLGMFALPVAFGASDCDDPRCYAQLKTSRSSPIDGLQFDLDSPSVYINRDPNVCENFAASAGWMKAKQQPRQSNIEWLEAGVTSGFIKNVGCTSKLTAYYGFNNVFSNSRSVYQEQTILPKSCSKNIE